MDYAGITSQTDKMVSSESRIYNTKVLYKAETKLQEKTHIYNENAYKETDSYIYSGQMEQTEFKSDNYNDILKITGLPANSNWLSGVYDDSSLHGEAVLEKIEEVIVLYSDGSITDEELKDIFCGFCKDTRMYHIQNRHTSGINTADNQEIASIIYEYAQKTNVRRMVDECFKKGEEIAKNYGWKGRPDWVYYDADYYYKAQHVEKLLKEAASEIAKEWNMGTIDFDAIAKNSDFGDGGLDFNSTWDWEAINTGISKIKNFNCKPEPGFALFYEENKHKISGSGDLESQLGICIVKSHGKIWVTDVPFNNSLCLGRLADCFNVGSLFNDGTLFKDENLLQFLGNFDIFTYVYGHNNYWQ